MKIGLGNLESLRPRRFVNMLCFMYESLWVGKPLNRLYFIGFFLIFVPVLILSVTIFNRQPLIKQATEEINSSTLLWAEIESAKAVCSEKEMNIALANWEDVRRRLPGSYDDVSEWILELNRHVSLRGLKMSYNLGELRPAYKGSMSLSLLPINLKMIIQGVGAIQNKSATIKTRQFVELLHEMVKSSHGVDIASVLVIGTGDGIKSINVSINLWVGFGSEPYINQEV